MDAKPKLAFSFKKTVPSIGSNGVSAFSGNGLNQASSSSSQASSKSQAPKTTPITGFGGDDSGGEDDEDVASAASGSRQSQSSSKTKRNKFGMGAVPPSKASAARQAEALQLDANINDYDGVWDAMKSAEKEKQALIDEQAKTRESKYSSAFAASATRRKIDRARAEAKKIARERDAEGAEYGDTEEFVTEAYKKQMEEIAEMEKREEEEEKRNRAAKAGGMATFQKDMLASRASAHDAAVAASLRPQEDGKDAAASRGTQETAEENASATSHRKLAEEARAKGLDVRLNDDGELVDERSVLSAGLNHVSRRAKGRDMDIGRGNSRAAYQEARPGRDGAQEAREMRNGQRARHSQMLEEQMMELQAKRERDEEDEMREKKRKLIGDRSNDEKQIGSAKERYMRRKAEREAAADGGTIAAQTTLSAE